MTSEIEAAARALLEATGPEGELVQFVRDPLTGERGVVVAVRGDSVDVVLRAVVGRRPSLAHRIARSVVPPD